MKKICINCGTDNPANFRYCTNCGHELPKTETAEEIPAASAAVPDKRTARAAPTGIPARTRVIPPPNNGGKRKSSKLWIILVSIAAFFVLIAVAGWLVLKTLNSDKVMVVMASQLNAKAPMMIDDATRFDKAVVLPGNIFQYNCTLINIEKGQLDTANAKEMLEPGMIAAFKVNPQLAYFRSRKTTLSYLYKDKNGEYLFSIFLTPDKYQ